MAQLLTLSKWPVKGNKSRPAQGKYSNLLYHASCIMLVVQSLATIICAVNSMRTAYIISQGNPIGNVALSFTRISIDHSKIS